MLSVYSQLVFLIIAQRQASGSPAAAPNHNCPDIVKEGQNVQCACSVSDYGAPPGILQWDNTGSTQLSLIHVTRGDTGRQFVCRLTWNDTDVFTLTYTLNVTYPAVIQSLTLNSVLGVSVTVYENSTLTLSCEASGRPAPAMRLINDRDQVLSSVSVGATAGVTQSVTYSFSKVQFLDSGNYSCEVENGVGRDRKTVMLLVSCSPRASAGNKLPSVTFQHKEVQLQFNLTAYPTPEVISIAHLPLSNASIGSGSLVPNTTVSASCAPVKGQIASAVCTVVVRNVTSDNAGLHKLIVRNNLGPLEFLFEVKTCEEGSQCRSLTTNELSLGTGIGIGIGVGIMVGVFVVLWIPGVFCLSRRNWVVPCSNVKDTTPERSANSAEDRKPPECPEEPSGDSYDQLRMSYVGKKSSYANICTDSQDQEVSAYYEEAIEREPQQWT